MRLFIVDAPHIFGSLVDVGLRLRLIRPAELAGFRKADSFLGATHVSPLVLF